MEAAYSTKETSNKHQIRNNNPNKLKMVTIEEGLGGFRTTNLKKWRSFFNKQSSFKLCDTLVVHAFQRAWNHILSC